MSISENFQFSQSSLQDYVDCARRFQLRYIQQRSWPAAESAPALEKEIFMRRGAQFHQMVHQYFLSIPGEIIVRQAAEDEVIQRWWRSFEKLPKFDGQTFPEISLSSPIGDSRIVAKYDLIQFQILNENPDSFTVTIYDWKTSLKRPKRQSLISRLQTRVYPYLIVKAGEQLTPKACNAILPDHVKMIYWFTDFPDDPVRFPYSQEQFESDDAYLKNIISEIHSLGDLDAPLTADEWRCRFCKYRSLCNRGIEAGPLEEMDSDGEPDVDMGFDLDLDFDQMVEIEF